MSERPQTCPSGHTIEWAGHWTGWCECAVWFWDDADNVLKPNMSPRERSILAALRQARADLEALEAAEKRIAELEAVLKSISDLQPDDEYINLDSSSANYDDCYRDGWNDGERKAAIMARSALGAHRD